MIVFDAGVIIAHLDGDDAFHAPAVDFLDEHAGEQFAINVLTLAECLVHPVLRGRGDAALAAVAAMDVMQVDLSATEALRLAQMRAETRLRMPDAVVLHTAERLGAAVATTDAAVARAAEERGTAAYRVG